MAPSLHAPPPTPVILVTPEEYEAALAQVIRLSRFGVNYYVFSCPVQYARALAVLAPTGQ